jgi:tetratricopeptide (TPR) repeat protein
VIRTAPNVGNYFYLRGVALFSRKDYDRAIADFGETMRLDPTIEYSLHLSGDAHRLMGDYERAIADYTEEFRRTAPNGQQIKDRAIAYLLAGQFDRAIEDFDAVAADNRFFVAIGRYGRGIARLRKGDIAGGNADFAEALDRDAGVGDRFAREGVGLNAPPRDAAPTSHGR